MEKKLTSWSGFREKAEMILGRERMWLQTLFQDRLTQEAKANDFAGNHERMFWRRSSFMEAMKTISVFFDFSPFPFRISFFFFVWDTFSPGEQKYFVSFIYLLGLFVKNKQNFIGPSKNRPSNLKRVLFKFATSRNI